MDDWMYIGELDSIIDGVEQIHVDTRDFYVILREDPVDLRDCRHPEITKNLFNEDYFIKKEEILPMLRNLETISGGKVEWRHIFFKEDSGIDDEGWLKYIRIYKIHKGKNSGDFIVCNRDSKPFKWRLMSEDTIESDYLNAH